jgi:ATP-dependent Clp protease protease subunit
MNRNDFERFASLDRGISPMTLHCYGNVTSAYINPAIIEERKLNVASMDVFSRLMMDRIIFLGVGIDDDVANIIQAQLLYLASTDDKADISIYLNTPEVRFRQVLQSMIQCSSYHLTLPQSVREWRHLWAVYF